jgi:hypothetical protein
VSIDADSYSICAPIKGITKQYSVCLNKGAISRVLCYLQRPKGVSDDEWKAFISGITLNLEKEMKT